MKIQIALAVVALATLSTCLPGAKRAAEDDVEIIPTDRKFDPFGVVDLEANPSDDFDEDFPGLGHSWRDNFSSFMKRIHELVSNVRTQVAQDFEDKLKKGNTTSTVEVINGHKVIKNQTVYEDPHSYIKSIVYEVVPNGEDTTNTSTNTEVDVEEPKKPKDREPLEESAENEVNALNEGENINIETLEDHKIPPKNFAYKITNDENWQEISIPEDITKFERSPFENIETLENEIPIEEGPNFKPYDLQSDIKVNDILKERGYPINPDAEIFDVEPPRFVVV